MKLSALAAQIKGCGHCEVINNGGRIFVGTGSAFYCMDGYPRTQDAGELGAMLGIPQKKMKNIFYHEEYTMDGKLYGVRWDDEPEHEGRCPGGLPGQGGLDLLKVGCGAPGKRKSDSGHIVVRFTDGLDRFGNAGQIVNRDAARFAAAFGCITQNAVVCFAVAAGAVAIGNAGVTCALNIKNAGLFEFHVGYLRVMYYRSSR